MTSVNPCLRAAARVVGIVSLCASSACLKPEQDNGLLYSSYVLPADAGIPRLEDDMAAGKKLAANSGFSGLTIPLRTGFVAGNEVHYWDLGVAPSLSAKPMWIFRRHGDQSADEIGHPNLVDSIPGDTAYTPLRQLYVVFVTAAYNGERITSLRALEDAVELKLVEAPAPQDRFVNCVGVLSTMQLQAGGDMDPLTPDATYYRGETVYQFCIGGFEPGVGAFTLKDGIVTAGNAYLVRRTNEAQPIDEALFKTDLNGDGDMVDTNTVFDSNVRDMSYVSVWHSLDVVVPADYKFGDAKAESDLFDKVSGQLIGKAAKVLQYKDNGTFLNRPIQPVTP
jgi:hypothetical protein